MVNYIIKYFHTIKYLKVIQFRYQLWYRTRRFWRKLISFKYPLSINKKGEKLILSDWINKSTSFEENTFTFLNQSKTFPDNEIEWDFSSFGKLWTYNLNYFDFLLQPKMNFEIGLKLIRDFILKLNNNSTALEPYPIALRGINWIKFISKYESEISEHCKLKTVNFSLYAQYQILLDNIEYHLLGNHLLEDGFSLLFGAFYFNDNKFFHKANQIIISELKEQILDDGGHFELSPMYHQIILDRLLDCINLVQNNQKFDNQDNLLALMKVNAYKMLEWLNAITFSNNEIPLFNDSAPGIAPSTDKLNKYANNLNFKLETFVIGFSPLF